MPWTWRDRRGVLRAVMATLDAIAGIVHLATPDSFPPIVPDRLPLPRCETKRWRRAAGLMLALYAICLFPTNVKHAVDAIRLPQVPDSWRYHGPRLAFQPVLAWWALNSSGIIDWPFAAGKQI